MDWPKLKLSRVFFYGNLEGGLFVRKIKILIVHFQTDVTINYDAYKAFVSNSYIIIFCAHNVTNVNISHYLKKFS